MLAKTKIMKFLKNLVKLLIIGLFGFATLMSCVPLESVVYYVWPFTIPLWFLIGVYCYTYKTDPYKMFDKFMGNDS